MDIIWDIQNHTFVKSVDESNEYSRFDWILRDLVSVDLYVCTPSSDDQGYTPAQAPAGWVPKFAAKHEDSLSGEALVYQGTWTWVAASNKYTAQINLNTSLLIAAVGSSDEYDVIAEFVLENASGDHRDSTQITLRVTPDVNRGTESAPESEWYPWRQEFTSSSGHLCIRLMNSNGEICLEAGPPGATIP